MSRCPASPNKSGGKNFALLGTYPPPQKALILELRERARIAHVDYWGSPGDIWAQGLRFKIPGAHAVIVFLLCVSDCGERASGQTIKHRRHVGVCQNYGPFLGTLNNRCRTILGTQKGTLILTTTHVDMNGNWRETRKEPRQKPSQRGVTSASKYKEAEKRITLIVNTSSRRKRTA